MTASNAERGHGGMDGAKHTPWEQLTEEATQLAATFGKRRTDGTDEGRIAENLAELTAALGTDPGGTVVRRCALLRIVAGGCGLTAFALAERYAAAAGEGEAAVRGADHAEAAVLLGLAGCAYRLAVAAIKERSTGADSAAPAPALLPGTQFAVARMRAELASADALLGAYARAEDDPHTVTTRADSAVPRLRAGAVAEQVVSTAYEQIRGGHQETERRVARIWQDVKSGPRPGHDADRALELIGKAAFGIDPAQSPRWL
ncbi:acyl-CoA dehydrogenase family protein [Streptomyces sp. 8N114]|uniref:acyl-CoA dehydrogenase family protein n=1 Tax=Streptomyces sp. 8N114 TaxID=3457419 RepID=UPI003FD0A8A9